MRTAERAYCDEADQRYLFTRCMVPYRHIAEKVGCAGLRVLDAGAGSGGGSAILARAGARVCAVDFSAEDVHLTVRECPLVQGFVADVYALPLADASFDLVISCHVLEHLTQPERYLEQLLRVLRPGGTVWVITPNRRFSSPDGPPANPFHVKEYFFHEFAELVRGVFPDAEFQGVHHAAGGGVQRAHQAQARLHALDVLGLRRLIPPGVKKLVRRLTGAAYPTELTHVEPSDFALQAGDCEGAVDLLAVATRPASG